MPLLAKIHSTNHGVLPEFGPFDFSERHFKSPPVSSGQEVFVWLSENSGGYGLAGIGVLLFTNECTVPKKNGNGTHPGLLLNVFMLSTRVFEPLNQSVITELSEDAPLGIREEARAHSLNGIKQIDEQSAEFIRLRFTQG